MLAPVLLPDSRLLQLDQLTVEENRITIRLSTTAPESKCPVCAELSGHIHSHYSRTIADLPWAAVPVRLLLCVRKFFCRNATCTRMIFTERLPTVVAPWARRSLRLAEAQRWLGLAVGGEVAARTGQRLGLPASPDTLLRMVRHRTLPARSTPRILGVDDWAWRKGTRYGTILIDLETHKPVDLLADRTADTLAAWLQAHPGVEVISRDRSGAYADGATRGAPEAIQVADRFHLLANLRVVLETVIVRHGLAPGHVSRSAHRSAPPVEEPQPASAPDGSSVGEAPPVQRRISPAALRYEPIRLANRARRKARYDEVVALHQQGMSQKAIGTRLNLSGKTIRRWLRAGSFPELAPKHKRVTRMGPYVAYLQRRWAEGCHNGAQLWREICQQGYTGSRSMVADWVAHQRRDDHTSLAPAPPRSPRPPSEPAVTERVYSPRQLSWLLIQDSTRLDTDQHAVLNRLMEKNAALKMAYAFAQEFRQLVKARQSEEFDAWLEGVLASNLPDLRRFAAGLQRDAAAVRAALSLPFSNGPVEGHVNRLKFIKRQGYGRAGFDLLKQRVLAA